MNNVFPIAFLDAPQILNMSVTPIPGSASLPLQVVNDLGFKAAYAIDYIDTSGDFIGVYIGSTGAEVLRCIIGGGADTRVYVVLHAHARVSLRSMTASSITNGMLTCVFMGMGWA